MHILFYTPAFPPFHGGGERYARSLALALAACGHQLTVVTSHARHEQQLWQGTAGARFSEEADGPLAVLRCPLRPFPGGWRGLLAWRKAMVLLSLLPGDHAARLERMARRVPALAALDRAPAHLSTPPTLVHGFNLSWEHALLAARDVAQARNLPFVITPFAHFGTSNQTRVALNSTMDHQRRLLQQADAVLTLTPVEGHGFDRWNIHPRRLAVVGGGVDEPPPLPPAAGAAVFSQFGLEHPFALFLGRATHDKGAIHASEAVLHLVQRGIPVTLALAGRVAADFRRFYDSLDASSQPHIRLLGPIDETAKHTLLREAAILLLPSQAESFGIVLLEAWQHATPVVAARAGGIPGVVDDEQNGLLVPFGDVAALAAAMRRLLHDPELRHTLGRQGLDKVRREYSWQRVAARVLAVYQEITT